MTGYRTVLLSLEGTLVDSSDGQASAWARALRNAGIEVPFAEVRERMGMGADNIVQDLSGLGRDSVVARRILAEVRQLFRTQHLANVRVRPGSRDLLAHLRSEDYSLVLMSSDAPDAPQTVDLLNHTQLLTAFDDVVTLVPGMRGKPAADSVLAALDHSRTDASEALLIGDTPYDIAAARAAGVACVAFGSSGWPDSALAGAVAIYRNPLDLLTNFEMSPLSRSTQFEQTSPSSSDATPLFC